MTKLTVQEALIHLMVVVSASDRMMADPELSSIGALVHTLPVFDGFPHHRILAVAQTTQERVQRENGLAELLDDVRDALPSHLHETAYMLATEVALTDLSIDLPEVRLLQILRTKLDLTRDGVDAIERVARIRYARLDEQPTR